MTAFFEYKGIKSTDLYMRIENNISFPSPEADIEFISIDGRDGDLAIDNKRLKDVLFSIPITIHTPAELTIEQVATMASNWLKTDIGWHKFRFSGSPSYEYEAMIYEQFDISETLKNYGKTILTFKLRPYKRRVNVNPYILTNGSVLMNTEKRIAKPIINITGNGNMTFKNNGKDWFILESVDSNITIDSGSMSVFKHKSLPPQFTKMKSHLLPLFPILEIGENKITWTGNVTKVEIIARWEAIT